MWSTGAYAARVVRTCFLGHIQGRDPFLEARRRGDCWVETEDEEEYLWTLRSGKPHSSSGPASLCLPAAITLTCGQPLGVSMSYLNFGHLYYIFY